MKELHARVEAGLERAKAVLENPNSSQEEVNAQIQSMRELTEEVNKAMAGGVTSPAQLGEGRSVTQSEASPTPRRGRRGRGPLTPPATPAPVENQETKETAEGINKALTGGVTSPAELGEGRSATQSEASPTPRQGRRGRKPLTPPAAPVSTENQEKKETEEEATDYTNGQGSYPLSETIHNLLQELKTSTENPEQVQKLKEAYDKLNEALQTKEDGLVDQEVFNAALEEYKKAAHLKKGAEDTGETRNRRSVSGLVYGLSTGSRGKEKRLTYPDGSERDNIALLNGSDLDEVPLRFIATVQNGGIREFSLSGFPSTDASGRQWATTTVTYSPDRKKAIIEVRGKTPKNIYGLYNVTPVVVESNGHRSEKIQQVRYQLPKPEFDVSPDGSGKTAQQSVEGKAKERPILGVKIPLPPNGDISTKNIPYKGQLRVFLVRGGYNEKFGSTETSATGYDIVAWGLIGSKGTAYIVPPQYTKESIGDQRLRLVLAYTQQNTNNIISDDFVSSLSDDSITPTNPIDRDGANSELDTAAGDKKTAIGKTPNLTAEEIAAAQRQVDEALAEAKRKVGEATDQAGVNRAKQEGLQALKGINPTPTTHNNANSELDTAAGDKKTAIGKTPNLTAEEIAAAQRQVDEALAEAKRKVGEATDQAGVNRAKQEGLQALKGINPTPQANQSAKADITQTANLTLSLIDDNANLSLFEKDTAKNQVRQALQDALKRIDQAKTQNEIDQAKQEVLSSLDQVLAEALAKANARTLSDQDKDQTSPSATRNRRTPPRRSRRSVGFVGNSQTGTTPSAVDKSELQSLVDDLEHRLQDLADLSPEALEEAQSILREAQVALDNDSLTAQELAELLAKVRQALNSIKAGTSADKSPSTSNSNKEAESAKEPTNATDVPLYGVFGAAVLSLLGALLFAVARKKNSQLDNLSRELDQLLVELEASDKDKKGLGKAKKLAKRARTFVDSQQKDPQKEAELISEIKTILSQLREGV
ncbi:surface anchored protein [Streptococcus pneumoniae]|nr:surface anchored protein [Streptococcus pneumoniae]